MTRRRFALTGGATTVSAPLQALQQLQLARVASLGEFEALAKAQLSATVFDFVAGGAANETTLRANLEAWDKMRLRTRVLVDVSQIDIRVRLFGRELRHPVLLAPTAYHRLFHRNGEIETARGAAASDTPLVVSSFATTLVEEIAQAAPTHLWFQLYVQRAIAGSPRRSCSERRRRGVKPCALPSTMRGADTAIATFVMGSRCRREWTGRTCAVWAAPPRPRF